MRIACSIALIVLAAPPAGGTERIIDEFRYADAPSARRAWRAREGTDPVETVVDGRRPVVQVAAPFAGRPKLLRTVIDREVKLDAGSASLEKGRCSRRSVDIHRQCPNLPARTRASSP